MNAPDQQISQLAVLTDQERQQLVVDWNDTSQDYPHNSTLHELFEAQVKKSPDRVALMFNGKSLTFHELNCHANRLAHRLKDLGIGPGVRVGLCIERSLDLMVGLIAILKAGAAYVALDPHYPAERLGYMLEDSRAPLLLTHQRFLATFNGHPAHVLCLDTEPESIVDARADNPISGAGPDDVAYVLYTSGSTGQPKGVLGTHRGAVNRCHWMWQRYPFERGELCCQKTTLSFGDAMWEIFGPLLQGVPLLLVPEDVVKDIPLFIQVLANAQSHRLVLVPSLLSGMLTLYPDLARHLPDLTIWSCSGEALSQELYHRFTRALPGRVLLNLYGSSEVSADATWYELRAASESESVLIGRPIANTQVYVLDAHLQPVPIGVPGELYVGGVGVARGYWNRPELTAERFIPDPFGEDSDARLFKTGDLVRWRSNGHLEFLGRRDHQVKIRGFRVELGEVEAALLHLPAIREAVVLAREDIPGERRLVAYLVPHEGLLPPRTVLRAALQLTLPEFMVPSLFVELPALPLTPSGKINRRALPVPVAGILADEPLPVAARTPVEEVLVGLWVDLLQLEHVGIFDNFFEVGGHSLLATQLVGRVRSVFSLEMPLRTFFNAPTIAALAEFIDAQRREGASLALPPLISQPRPAVLPLSLAQQRLWFLDQLEPGSAQYSIAVAVRLLGPLQLPWLEQSFQEVIRRHESLRTTFSQVDGLPYQVIAADPSSSLRVLDTPEEDVDRMVREEAHTPFDLTCGPLFRMTLVRVATDHHVLLLTLHHIISDGWSMGVFIHEVGELYNRLATDRPAALPALPLQYADVALWQQTWLTDAVLDHQVAYWKTQLAGASATLDLPTVRPRPAMQTYRGASVSGVVSRPLASELYALDRREGVTVFMSLLAVFQMLLQRYSGQDDVVVGSPIAGRTQAETEGVIGFFINTLVLRTDLSGNPTFRQLLARVREVTLGAYANQDVPFEKVVEVMAPARDLSRSPLFQVFFNLLNLPSWTPTLAGIEVQAIENPETVSKFDLNLYAKERAGEILLTFIYNPDLFDRVQIETLRDHLLELLAKVVSAPDVPNVQHQLELPDLCGSPSRTIRGEPGPNFESFPESATEQCIVQRFDACVARYGSKRAIVWDGPAMSYRELDALSRHVAQEIVRQVGSAGVRVALLFQSDPALVGGILGTLRAGAAYVPLDPTYPTVRLSSQLQDAGVSLLLTHRPCFASATAVAPPGCPVIDVEAVAEGFSRDSSLVPATDAHSHLDHSPRSHMLELAMPDPGALAYLLYTSGSTGRPKGVAQSHRNELRHIRNYANRLFIDANDVIGLVASYACDAGVMDIFGAVLTGATVCLIDVQGEGLQELPKLLRQHGVTLYHSTPTVYRHLIAGLEAGEVLEGIRRVVLGGEECRRSDVEAWRAHFESGCVFVNGLGLTEATLSLQNHLESDPEHGEAKVPVGYPVEGVEVSLRGGEWEQVAVYGLGEIVLRSQQLALGYWEGTEGRVREFPFVPERDGVREFWTGDLARRLPGGTLVYEGRRDHQVKVRGNRIELGEVENVLKQHVRVATAVVMVKGGRRGEDRDEEPYLVAYVVTTPEPTSIDWQET